MANDGAGALYQVIGKRVASVRRSREKPISQAALGFAVGLSRTSIANIEKGRHRIQIHTLYSIAAALAVEPAELLPARTTRRDKPVPKDLESKLKADERSSVSDFLSKMGGENDAKD